MRFKGQALLSVVLVLALLIAVAGCARQTAPAPPEEPKKEEAPPAPTPVTGPKTGGTVTIGIWSEPSNFNPLIWPTAYDRYMHELLYNRLVRPNEQLAPVPDLAEKWEISADGRTITFTLRKGVKWHDGKPLTAEDVAFTFRSMAHPLYDGGSYSRVEPILGAPEFRAGKADDVEGIKVIDEHTIAFTTAKPSATVMANCFMQTEIIPKHILGDVPPDQWKTHGFNTQAPIGTGPYKFVKYETSRYAEFAANPDYWDGRPYIDKVIFRIGDQNTMLAAFINQEVDIVQVPLGEIEAVKELKYAEMKVYDSTGFQYVGLNLRVPAFSDLRVRQAIAHAINKEQIVRSLLRGYAVPIDAPCSPNLWPYPPNPKRYQYDPARARALLEEAGWVLEKGVRVKEGARMEFELLYPTGNLVRMQFVPIIQQNLEAIGIKTNLRAVDFPTMVGHLLPRDAQGKLRPVTEKDFQIYVLGFGLSTGDPDSLRSYFHSAHMPPNGYNFIGCNDPKIDELWDKSSITVNFAERKAIVHELMTLLSEYVPWIPLYSEKHIWVNNTRVKNFAPNVHGLSHNIAKWYID